MANLPTDFVTDKPAKPKKKSTRTAKAKGKSARSAKAQPSVLGSLPATRPTRLGRRPEATTAQAKAGAATRSRSKASTTTARPKPRPAKPPPPPPPPEEPRRPSGPPSGTEIVTTAVQAVGEIAQIGLAVGARALRRAARRIQP
jgi:hypothetical protein